MHGLNKIFSGNIFHKLRNKCKLDNIFYRLEFRKSLLGSQKRIDVSDFELKRVILCFYSINSLICRACTFFLKQFNY